MYLVSFNGKFHSFNPSRGELVISGVIGIYTFKKDIGNREGYITIHFEPESKYNSPVGHSGVDVLINGSDGSNRILNASPFIQANFPLNKLKNPTSFSLIDGGEIRTIKRRFLFFKRDILLKDTFSISIVH